MTAPAPETHLDPGEIAGYVEGSLGPDERARIETHLADCEECTGEIAALVRLRPRAAVPVRWLTLAAAAAAVAVLVVGQPQHDRPAAGTGPLVRGDSTAVVVTAVTPTDGAEVTRPVGLVWHAVPDAFAYRVSVTRSNGDSVWSATVHDTTVAAPDSALAAGAYFWYVDALLSDGRPVAGKAREFRVAP
jgi:anti-sigma factor RsiW